MARDFAKALGEVPDACIVAVASRSRNKADQFGDRFDIPGRYSDCEQMVSDPNVDVVYIATPHSHHRDHAILSLEANKAVLCEKPFTINAEQASDVISLARAKNLFLMEAMWTRYVPAVLKLKELLSANAIGDVQIMLAGGAYMPEPEADHYLFNAALGGGILLDAGVYLVSMASLVFGDPDKVLATGAIGNYGVDEHDAIVLSHEKGQIANLYVSHRASSSPDMTLLGSKGKIYLHPPVFCPSGLTLSIDSQPDQFFDFSESGNGYRFQAMEVNRCLKNGLKQSESMPLDETLSIMRTMDIIRQQIGLQYPMES
jgi:predicted dehydrogenase